MAVLTAKHLGIVLIATCGLCAEPVSAQSTAELMGKVIELQSSVNSLNDRIDELTRLLRPLLPPTPVETTAPVQLSLSGMPVLGSTAATVVIVDFSDFECPFCGQHSRDVFDELYRKYVGPGKVIYAFNHLPLTTIHPHALDAAKAAECARAQGRFWEMRAALFRNQSRLDAQGLASIAQEVGLDSTTFSECIGGRSAGVAIADAVKRAESVGIAATPTFLLGVHQNGIARISKRISGVQSVSVFEAAISDLLRETNVGP